MQIQKLSRWQHSHDFAVIHKQGEKRTWQVLILTAVTMVIEIAAGITFGSMALLADGWHMGTHVAAFMITIFAYFYARKHAESPAFTFGTGKVSVLGGFASAIALAAVALMMCVESVERIINPREIHFNQAIGVAVLGLFINIISAFLLQGSHHHGHHHEHEDNEEHHHHDHNLKAAYFHVLADALTSLLAITALTAGKYFGWNQLDPVMGIVGAVVITRWSYTLLRETAPILLDGSIEEEKKLEIKTKIESDSDNRIADLHLWKVGPDDYAAIISIVTHYPKSAEHYKSLLKQYNYVSHITIEVNQCGAAEGDRPCNKSR
ncbi:Cation diffusion facilitator family transporter [Desulfonema limicola]|uniref:Cation diffusion facilitator family transporter n=1 Tax=Desulfonema limicola TaxID=45656 RepID=A0A975B8I4_9BACT|nr:CDF family Co(II)/Ni(II) efflux transporter DmeF [Desulfonema limicola]QTA80708.1 Cation diffusion facilitator family transporter [Desulfonema limicola]